MISWEGQKPEAEKQVACLGGTPGDPRHWRRQQGDERTIEIGRICRTVRRRYPLRSTIAPDRDTKASFCSGCPAYRGIRTDGTVANGITAGGDDWYALSDDEYSAFVVAEKAREDDDDYGPWSRWWDRMDGAGSWWHLRGKLTGDDEKDEAVAEWWAEYMRSYRGRARARSLSDPALLESRRAYERDRKRRQRAAKNCPVDPLTTLGGLETDKHGLTTKTTVETTIETDPPEAQNQPDPLRARVPAREVSGSTGQKRGAQGA